MMTDPVDIPYICIVVQKSVGMFIFIISVNQQTY